MVYFYERESLQPEVSGDAVTGERFQKDDGKHRKILAWARIEGETIKSIQKQRVVSPYRDYVCTVNDTIGMTALFGRKYRSFLKQVTGQ